jgi:hypothetical protein
MHESFNGNLRRYLFFFALIACVAPLWAGPVVELPATYAGEGQEEQIPYGPAALRYAPDGTFWIVNPADNTLTNLHADGRVLRQFRLDQVAVALTDVRFPAAGTMEVLDASANPPAVFNVSETGAVRDRRELRMAARSLSPPRTLADDGDFESHAADPLAEWYEQTASERWSVSMGTNLHPDGAVETDAGRFDVAASGGVIRGIRVLSSQERGLYLLVEEVWDTDPITVDATVRLYADSGTLLGIGRVPVADQYTFVEHPVAVSSDGTVYLLETRAGYMTFARLRLETSFDTFAPLVPDGDRRITMEALAHPAIVATASSITRKQVTLNALAYVNNRTYYSNSALNGTCRGRDVPRHLAGQKPGNYNSVAYAWGHGDSVADYNKAISSGSPAGDIDSDDDEKVLACARGVDCSGFISNVWGLSGKVGTCDLANNDRLTMSIRLQELGIGDVLVKCRNHVVLVDGVTSSGLNVFEATTDKRVDRVVYTRSNAWSRYNGWSARRYHKLRVTPTTPAHLGSSVSPRSAKRDASVTFESRWKNEDGTPMRVSLIVRLPSGSTRNYEMELRSGSQAFDAEFRVKLRFPSRGQYAYAVVARSSVTDKTARYPSSGFVNGPTIK